MSERRISIQKLSKYLRILEDDLIEYMYAAGLEPSTNSQGHLGYKPEEIKNYISNLSEEGKLYLFSLKRKWEEAHEIYVEPLEEYLSKNEVADLFGIQPKNVATFMNTNNVHKVRKNNHIFWNMKDVLKIKFNPTKKQSSDLHKLKTSRIASSHLSGKELAEIMNVPIELVNKYKKVLRIENIYPLTKDKVLDIVSDPNYSKRRDRFLNRNETKNLEIRTVSETYPSKGKLYGSNKAAEIMGITVQKFRKVTKRLGYEPDGLYVNRYKQEIKMYSYATILEMSSREEYFTPSSGKEFNELESLEKVKQNIIANVYDNVEIRVPSRYSNPYFANFYVGPTNSGKTFNALNNLYAEYEEDPEGLYVYAAPLRMLAFEVYQKMVARYGRNNVGFITGEENINPNAPLLACTVEMTPISGTSLVLDEAHWIVEPARGHKWTKLLAGGLYQNLHILTASEALETIKKLVDDAYELRIQTFERKTPIVFRGDISIKDIPSKSVVVCFSRKAVYRTAQMLIAKSGKNVGVLYGALPLVAREQQINDFIDGKTDIIVATDVIGHGINLPVDNVIFAETDKFDGDEKRELHLWEAAQIAGRAGRYGLSEQGSVYSIRFDWNNIDKSLIEAATLAAGGTIGTNLQVSRALTAPSFGDLHVMEPESIMLAVEQWGLKLAVSEYDELYYAASMKEQRARLEALGKHLKTPVYPWDMIEDERENSKGLLFKERALLYNGAGKATNRWLFSAKELWQVIDGVFDPNLPTIQMVGRWLQSGKDSNVIHDFIYMYVDNVVLEETSIEDLETLARITSELKMMCVIFDNPEGLFFLELEHFEEMIGKQIIVKILNELNNQSGNYCVDCGAECAVYYSYCSDCFDNMNQIHYQNNNKHSKDKKNKRSKYPKLKIAS